MKSSARTVRNALFGKGLGLTATQGKGAPWEELANFNIRGLQSLSGSAPLILIDGIERRIDEITTEEVENVYVLKDAAAVALYGSKGVNGVISIVTKRGYEGKGRISISYDHGFMVPKHMPDMADSYTYALAMNEAYANDGKIRPRYNGSELNTIKNQTYPNVYPNVNWWDETIKNLGHSNNINVNFVGGNKLVKYYTMFNLEGSHGFFKHVSANEGYSTQMQYSKANLRSNLDMTLSPTTQLQVNLSGILSESNSPGRDYNDIMKAIYTTPSLAFPVKTEDGVWGGNYIWKDSNPVAALESTGYVRTHTRTLFADAKLTQDLSFWVQGLSLSARIAYDNSIMFSEKRTKSFEYASDVPRSADGSFDDLVRIEGGKLSDLQFNKQYGLHYYNFNFIGNIDYARTWGDHKLFTSLIYHFDHMVSNQRDNTFNRLNYYWYTHYGLKDRYFVDLSLGFSGSNRLPEDHKYSFSPVLSLAWVISKENFLSKVSWLDELKLRASAGILHSEYAPLWNMNLHTFGDGNGYYFKDDYATSGGMEEKHLACNSFMSERAIKYNLGLDFKAWKSLKFTLDAYYQRRDRIMVSKEGVLSDVLGIKPTYVPEGIVDSKGFEMGIDFNRKVNEWTLTAGANFTLSKNNIVEQLEQPRSESYLRRTGHGIGQLFALEAIGFFKDDQDIVNSPKQYFSEVRPGDIKYKDQNNDGIIDENDNIAMGYNVEVPELYYSFHLGAEYKGLGFDALFQGTGRMGAFLDIPSVYRPLADNNTISQFYYDNRWTAENTDAMFPRLTSESNENNYQLSSIWYSNASYLKLRHCEVYYKFPVKLCKKIKMSNAKLYLRGMDLLSINKMDLYDPEDLGITYPQDWSIHLGLAIGF